MCSPCLTLVVHVQDALAAGGHFAGGPPLLLAELALGALVAEHLHLAVAAMHQIVEITVGDGAAAHVSVDLEVHGQPLHAFLQREVRGQALYRQGDECWLLRDWPDIWAR